MVVVIRDWHQHFDKSKAVAPIDHIKTFIDLGLRKENIKSVPYFCSMSFSFDLKDLGRKFPVSQILFLVVPESCPNMEGTMGETDETDGCYTIRLSSATQLLCKHIWIIFPQLQMTALLRKFYADTRLVNHH